MKQIKSFLFLVLFVVIIAGGTQVAYNRGWINSQQLAGAPFGKFFLSVQSNLNLSQLNLPGFKQLASSPSQETEVLTPNIGGATTQQAMITSAQEQGSTLLTRSQEMIGHVQKVLGDYVEVNEEAQQKTLSEKTLEYAKYQYCKQVVQEYENK